MTSPTFIIPSHHFVTAIQQTLANYPPRLEIPVYSANGMIDHYNYLDLPFDVDTIASRSVKVAGSPNRMDRDQFINELTYNLRQFDLDNTSTLIRYVNTFIDNLCVLFKNRGWYDSSGVAPHRFIGFTSGTFDIELRSS